MVKLDIKPLSVNECWQGRRFKTKAYNKYEKDLLLILPNITLPTPPLCVELEWGFSNSSSDIDNPIKAFLDVLQKKYKFNDKDIYEAIIKKAIVKKGEEYIRFSINDI